MNLKNQPLVVINGTEELASVVIKGTDELESVVFNGTAEPVCSHQWN